MKLRTVFIFLILALAINSQAQNIVFSNTPIGEDEKATKLTAFTLGEGAFYQRTHFTDFVTNLYDCSRCNLAYFVSMDGEILGRNVTRLDGWNPKIAKEQKSYTSSMLPDTEEAITNAPAAAHSFFDVIMKGNLEPNKSYEIKVVVYIDENRDVVSEGSFTLNTPDKAALEAFIMTYESQFLKPTFIRYDLPFKAGMSDKKIEKTLIKVLTANMKYLVYGADLTIEKAYIMATEEEWKGDDGNTSFPVVLFAKGSDGKCYRIEAKYASVMKKGKPSKEPVLKSKNAFELPCVIANKYM